MRSERLSSPLLRRNHQVIPHPSEDNRRPTSTVTASRTLHFGIVAAPGTSVRARLHRVWRQEFAELITDPSLPFSSAIQLISQCQVTTTETVEPTPPSIVLQKVVGTSNRFTTARIQQKA